MILIKKFQHPDPTTTIRYRFTGFGWDPRKTFLWFFYYGRNMIDFYICGILGNGRFEPESSLPNLDRWYQYANTHLAIAEQVRVAEIPLQQIPVLERAILSRYPDHSFYWADFVP